MSFLAPLFLLGAVAVGLPLWLHRLQTESRKRVAFSSVMLLEQSLQPVHLQKRFRYLSLLALRVALLLLLALMFAKPVLERPPLSGGQQSGLLHLIVMDTSFSMQTRDGFARAKSAANAIIRDMAAGDSAQIVAVDDAIYISADPSMQISELNRSLDQLAPGYGRLDFGVMVAGLDRLVRESRRDTLIHLISDFQSSGLPARFADLVPAADNPYLAGLELHPLAEPVAANLAVEFITRNRTGLDVGVRGYADEPGDAQLQVKLDGVLLAEQSGPVSGLTTFSFPVAGYAPGNVRVEAALSPVDALAEDNIRYAVVDTTPPAPVLLISADTQSLPVKYLTAALESAQPGYRVDAADVRDIDTRILQRYPWLVIDDLGSVNEALASVLLEYLHEGGAVLAALGAHASSRQTIPVSNYTVQTTLVPDPGQPARTVARIASAHPLLAGTRGWGDVRVSRLILLETDRQTQALVSLDGGAPLLLERSFGSGRMLLLTSSLDNSWNDLPRRPVFVNFVAEAAKYLLGKDTLRRSHVAGDYLQLPRSETASGQVLDPQGRSVLTLAQTHRSQQIKLDQPGFYEVHTPAGVTVLAVNPDSRESDLSIMPEAAMNRWRDAVSVSAPGTAGSPSSVIEQEPLELWPILLALFAFVLLAETVLGNYHLPSARHPIHG